MGRIRSEGSAAWAPGTIGSVMRLAVPAVMSNIAVPLLSLIDVAIVGHIGDASFIGGIAVGTMLFNLVYWLFGFLRMSTGGFASQALGRSDRREMIFVLLRALVIALCGALLLIVLQRPLSQAGLWLISPSEAVVGQALRYFRLLIFGAPAVLCLYAMNGWFLGMQNSRFPMYVTIFQSVCNILLSLIFVFVMKLQMAGVALGTLLAQYLGLMLAVVLWRMRYGGPAAADRFMMKEWVRRFLSEGWNVSEWLPFFRVNRDLFLRTLCLVGVTLYFTRVGARQGDTLLAVNSLLMQLFTLYSYFTDGFAYAGEALTGLCMGRDDAAGLRRSVRNVFVVGVVLAAVFTLLYALAAQPILSLLTDREEIIRAAEPYLFWALLIPFSGLSAFLWDGVFVGATRSRPMLLSLVAGAVSFFALQLTLQASLGNHALWLAFIVYLNVRGLVLGLFWKLRPFLRG